VYVLSSASISFPIFGESFIFDVPRSVSVFGFELYLYGLFITAGFILAGVYLYVRRDTFKLTKDNVLDLVIMAVPCGLLGARIYYIVFNASQYFGPGKWQNIIMFREGGLAVYGGVIGGAIAFYVYSRVKKIPVGKLLDAAGFGLFIGQAVGRWGNFLNREAYGVATGLPWRMGLTTGAGTIYVHPTFLYESVWNIVGLALMHIFSKKRKAKYHGFYFLFYVAWYGFGRFIIEGLRIDSLFINGTDIRISQLLAALSFGVAVLILIRNHLRGYTSDPEPELKDSEPDGSGESTDLPAAECEDNEDPGDEADVEDPHAEDTDEETELPEYTEE